MLIAQCQTFLHLICSPIRYLRIMRFALHTSEVLCVCMFYAIVYKANCTFCYNTEFSQRTAIVCIAKPNKVSTVSQWQKEDWLGIVFKQFKTLRETVYCTSCLVVQTKMVAPISISFFNSRTCWTMNMDAVTFFTFFVKCNNGVAHVVSCIYLLCFLSKSLQSQL